MLIKPQKLPLMLYVLPLQRHWQVLSLGLIRWLSLVLTFLLKLCGIYRPGFTVFLLCLWRCGAQWLAPFSAAYLRKSMGGKKCWCGLVFYSAFLLWVQPLLPARTFFLF